MFGGVVVSVARTTVTVCLLVIIKLAGHERLVMMETAGLHRGDDEWKISAQIYSLCQRYSLPNIGLDAYA